VEALPAAWKFCGVFASTYSLEQWPPASRATAGGHLIIVVVQHVYARKARLRSRFAGQVLLLALFKIVATIFTAEQVRTSWNWTSLLNREVSLKIAVRSFFFDPFNSGINGGDRYRPRHAVLNLIIARFKKM